MWLKNFDDLAQYIPQDGKLHNVQIVNDAIYVDGELKNSKSCYITDVHFYDRALSAKDIEKIYKKDRRKL